MNGHASVNDFRVSCVESETFFVRHAHSPAQALLRPGSCRRWIESICIRLIARKAHHGKVLQTIHRPIQGYFQNPFLK